MTTRDADLILSRARAIAALGTELAASGGTVAEFRVGALRILAAQEMLPLIRHGRRPKFFADVEVRELMVALHREVAIAEARRLCAERFGTERTPSKSALGRFWSYLDELGGRRK